MTLRFMISVPDKFVEGWLGIYGNETFNRLLYLYEMDPISKKINLVGIDVDTPLNRRKYQSYGFRDITDKVAEIFKPKPTKIDLFTFDITYLLYRYPELARKLKKFIRR